MVLIWSPVDRNLNGGVQWSARCVRFKMILNCSPLRAKDGGAEGIRTPDPHNAIVVLYQLSYDPIRSGETLKTLRRFVKTNCGCLFQTENLAAILGDHGLMPRRVPNNLDDGFFDAREAKQFLLGVARDGCAHAAAGRREGHLDGH